MVKKLEKINNLQAIFFSIKMILIIKIMPLARVFVYTNIKTVVSLYNFIKYTFVSIFKISFS